MTNADRATPPDSRQSPAPMAGNILAAPFPRRARGPTLSRHTKTLAWFRNKPSVSEPRPVVPDARGRVGAI
ncbi:hypothetical protein Sm713_12980 [Streptomyces sp. TS71-3]|nr:hypothetical protein Sm713_12980 [Streptomyces sp. TS71-3]